MHAIKKLREKGLKVTPARVEILELLQGFRKPLKVEDIWHKTGKKFDPATIYRALRLLSEERLVRQVNFKQGSAYYETLDEGEHHHHLICEGCEKVVDIECESKKIETKALKLGFLSKINNHSLEFFGLCKNCDKESRRNS